uniref:Inhibitor_I29 domain-containing protein n=1 Tax=Haemonchus contortus TaxID=6289 RepID=A0A7I5E7T1_HAECO|nr:unnamed protein product [Haemonchus contortus]
MVGEMYRFQMLFLLSIVALLVTSSSAKESELLLPEEEKETFKTINSMYTNGLVWSDEWAEKALEWLKSPDSRDSINAYMTVGGRRLLVNMDDKALWQKILEVLEMPFDQKEEELERLPAGTVYGCNGYMSTRMTKDDYVSAVCLYKKQ